MGQPAVTNLGDAGVDVGVLVEDLPDDEVGQKPRCPPRMGGGTRHDRIAPDVAIAGEIRWLVEKAVEEDRQMGVVHDIPKRRQSGWSIGLPSGKSGQTAATHGSFFNRFTSLTAHSTSAPGTRTILLRRLRYGWQ